MKRSPLRTDPAKVADWQRRSRRPIARKARLAKVNRTRKRERFERAYGSVERVVWYRSRGCVVPACGKPSEVVHVKSRAAGGTADDCVSMCNHHHRILHDIGTRSFERGFGLDLTDLAAAAALRWRSYIGG